MTFQETLDYLFSQLPMYQRMGKAAYKSDLSNTLRLCEILDHPETKFKSIHLAGTNGKGSTSHMIASVLQEAGYKVGLYTSPHLVDFRERIKINGALISEVEVVNFVEEYKEDFEGIDLSFFEWTVGLAFSYFAKSDVDIAIIETGLGGRLDSTNVVVPELSVVTNIGLDHTQFLGNTIATIAAEKAGIFKAHVPIVIGEKQQETSSVFFEKAAEVNAPLVFAEDIQVEMVECDLKGNYQVKNCKTALVTLMKARELEWDISDVAIKKGFLNVVKNTGLLGRWQVLQQNPTIICDTGHNDAGIKFITDQLKEVVTDKLHIVFGVVNDKSIDKVLALLPKDAQYYFCKANIPRALEAQQLAKLASTQGLVGEVYDSVLYALDAAKMAAKQCDTIFVGGSTFVVAEVL